MSVMETVYERIVMQGRCVGCGTCAGACMAVTGTGALRMAWHESGIPAPVRDSDACVQCGTCLSVCPLCEGNEDSTDMSGRLFPSSRSSADEVLGRYLALHAGYSLVHGHRENGAGGGLTTWFLEQVLEQGLADRVVCVVPAEGPDTFFRFALLDSPQALRAASRSAYYPVHAADVLAELAATEGRYALVGLPCVIRGFRLAAQRIPVLAERLVMTVGLTCGQARSRYFAEYLCVRCGLDAGSADRVRFRVKDPQRHQLDHRFECRSGAGDNLRQGRIYQTEGMGWLWGHDCFKVAGCNFCDDITAELADVSFADAVDEPHCHGNAGANFVMVRSAAAARLLSMGRERGDIFLENVAAEPVRKRMEGVELIKRRDLRHRLHLMRESGMEPPVLRQTPQRRDDAGENEWMELRDSLRLATTAVYAEHRHAHDVRARVEEAIQGVLAQKKQNG
ncbi:Coenzyme F420 hydrogenase/dehydrogenase, beta subunit C-terminal domain [Desulfovibrio mangrovi]|uniref:Coenzyme F420 hydrogenase/dehydrogenase, beta subunit C-terminal domain n=1 Tax=Desulfovibrio mangrovi TaxID=2976983 RepID=UPI002245371D|nr:Coenzyme F420 hydrogenase/dehydrogenase, beta subunit C-terminal domain [Desulfovibrio mangrovi]UZP66157.1 Coenzyme F420 hydrogenase/dehydrogenase, beta subunit C-terminal domain [Desulfovibrio mangrovi]